MNMYVVVVEPYDPAKGNMPTFFAGNRPEYRYTVTKPEVATWFDSPQKAEQVYKSFRNDFVGVDGIYRNYRIMTFREARALVLALGTVMEQSQKGNTNPPVIEVASTLLPEPPAKDGSGEDTQTTETTTHKEESEMETKPEETTTTTTPENEALKQPLPKIGPELAAQADVPTTEEVEAAKNLKFYKKTWFKVGAVATLVTAIAAGGWYGYQKIAAARA